MLTLKIYFIRKINSFMSFLLFYAACELIYNFVFFDRNYFIKIQEGNSFILFVIIISFHFITFQFFWFFFEIIFSQKTKRGLLVFATIGIFTSVIVVLYSTDPGYENFEFLAYISVPIISFSRYAYIRLIFNLISKFEKPTFFSICLITLFYFIMNALVIPTIFFVTNDDIRKRLSFDQLMCPVYAVLENKIHDELEVRKNPTLSNDERNKQKDCRISY